MTTSPRALLAALAILAATPAPADEVAEARARFEQGAQQFRAGRYREAIAAFEAAYRLKPHGAIHFNVAQCREKLGEWPAALRAYQDYLRELPEARDRAAVRAAIGRLEQRLAGAGVQTLLVYTDPPGAALRIDGKPRGRTPFHITLPPGMYRLGLALDGFAPEEQEVELNLASSRLVEVVLRPQAGRVAGAPATPPAAPGAPAATTAPAPAKAPVAASGEAKPPPPPPSAMASSVPVGTPAAKPAPDLVPALTLAPLTGGPRPSPPPPPAPPAWPARRVAAWTGAAVTLALVGAGVTYGLQARDTAAQLRDGTVRTAAAADGLAGDARAKARRANWLYGFGAAAAAATTTLFVLEGRF